MPMARQRSWARPVASWLDGEARIDARAGKEIAAHRGAGALGGHHDDVHVLGRHHAGLLLVGDGEAVREIEGVARLEVLFDQRPDGALGGVRHQHLDDGAPAHGLVDLEQRLARHPAVFDRAVPVALEGAGLADDDLEAVVAQVQRLGRPLHAVADDGDRLALEHLARLGHRELLAGDDLFLRSAEIMFKPFLISAKWFVGIDWYPTKECR